MNSFHRSVLRVGLKPRFTSPQQYRSFGVAPAKPQKPEEHKGISEPVFPNISNFLDRTAEVFFMTEIWSVIYHLRINFYIFTLTIFTFLIYFPPKLND